MDNPLETNPAREQRVRERAYQLWEADGRPHGRDVEYWQRARAEIAREESAEPPARLPDDPPVPRPADPSARTPTARRRKAPASTTKRPRKS